MHKVGLWHVYISIDAFYAEFLLIIKLFICKYEYIPESKFVHNYNSMYFYISK